jgi:hypothetical protein
MVHVGSILALLTVTALQATALPLFEDNINLYVLASTRTCSFQQSFAPILQDVPWTLTHEVI